MWPSSDESVSAVGAQNPAPNSWLERKLASSFCKHGRSSMPPNISTPLLHFCRSCYSGGRNHTDPTCTTYDSPRLEVVRPQVNRLTRPNSFRMNVTPIAGFPTHCNLQSLPCLTSDLSSERDEQSPKFEPEPKAHLFPAFIHYLISPSSYFGGLHILPLTQAFLS